MTDKTEVKKAIRELTKAALGIADETDRNAILWGVQMAERAAVRGGRDDKILEAIRRTDTIFYGGSWEETE